MDTRHYGAAKRLILSLAAGAALSGCVYAPPYAYSPAPVATTAYSYYPYYPYGYNYGYYGGYYGYGRPAYVGPPIALNFGYYRHSYRGGYGYRGAPAWRGHGWAGGRGGHGWGGARGGHGGGRGRR
jgi:hypothetical protein